MRGKHTTIKLFSMPGLMISDVLLTMLAVCLSIYIRFDGLFPVEYLQVLPRFAALASFAIIIFGIHFHCYMNLWESASVSELMRQGVAITLGYAVMFLMNSFMLLGMPRGAILIAWMLTFLFTLALRLSPKLLLWMIARFRSKKRDDDKKRILIFGAGNAGGFLAKQLFQDAESKRVPVGYIDDNEKLWNHWTNGLPVFGGTENLAGMVRRHRIDEVIVAVRHADRKLLKEIIDQCQKLKVKVSRFEAITDVDGKNITNAKIREVSVEELLGREPVQLDMEPVKQMLAGKTVLVTGGAGSIGSEICRQVLKWGCRKLVIFDFHENGLFDIEGELVKTHDRDRFDPVLGSIRDEKRLDEVFNRFKPDYVFHAAAHKHVPMMEWNPLEAIKNNVFGTWNVARKADEHGVKKMILISTDKAVNPTNIMGASKRCAELVVKMMNRQSETEYAAVRFGNVLGSNGSVVPYFKKQIAAGGPVTVTHPDILRYFMTIPEACQLVLQAGAMASGGELFVLDMGEPVRILDLAVALIQLSGLEPEKDIPITFTGLRPGEKMFEELRISGEDMRRTDNNKIFVMEQVEDEDRVVKILEKMQQHLMQDSIPSIFEDVHMMVPTFTHENFLQKEKRMTG